MCERPPWIRSVELRYVKRPSALRMNELLGGMKRDLRDRLAYVSSDTGVRIPSVPAVHFTKHNHGLLHTDGQAGITGSRSGFNKGVYKVTELN